MMKKRKKYILALMDEVTLKEAWHARVSLRSFFVLMTLLFLLTLGILSAIIVYTPLRSWLPGNTESMRRGLMTEASRVDSLATSLEVERQYLSVLKQVMAGEVSGDTVTTLDSMQIVMREQLIEAKNEALEDFKAQYEEKGRDNLLLFDAREDVPVPMFCPPSYGSTVTSVLAGTVVYTAYEINNGYTIVVQHTEYLSIYRQCERLLRKEGDEVRAGESIAIVDSEKPLVFQLWQNGKAVEAM